MSVGGLGKGADLDVKPLTANQELHAYAVLQQNTKVVTFEPHLHAAGTRMCLEAIWGTDIQTLSCAAYDHNWVRTYAYADDAMPLLPAGTILHTIGYHNNTASNRFNPDPDNLVTFGQRTIDDMSFAWMSWYPLSDEEYKQQVKEREEKNKGKTTQNQQ